MKQYNIYVDSSRSTKAIKQGWSWPAFFFVLFWVLVKRINTKEVALLVALILLNAILPFFDDNIDPSSYSDLMFPYVSVFFAVMGNRLLEGKLVSKGYALVDTVWAVNQEAAISNYFDNSLKKHEPMSEPA